MAVRKEKVQEEFELDLGLLGRVEKFYFRYSAVDWVYCKHGPTDRDGNCTALRGSNDFYGFLLAELRPFLGDVSPKTVRSLIIDIRRVVSHCRNPGERALLTIT